MWVTYYSESAYKHVRRIALRGDNLVDEVGSDADNSDEGDELHGAEGREGHA